MRASEILRKLADVIDRTEGESSVRDQTPHQDQRAKLHDVEVDNTDCTDQTVMMSPLQQKLELLKKAAGVDSAYDDETSDDELDVMKRNAGIKVITLDTAGEDNDIAG